jgi:hypothetical protein
MQVGVSKSELASGREAHVEVDVEAVSAGQRGGYEVYLHIVGRDQWLQPCNLGYDVALTLALQRVTAAVESSALQAHGAEWAVSVPQVPHEIGECAVDCVVKLRGSEANVTCAGTNLQTAEEEKILT